MLETMFLLILAWLLIGGGWGFLRVNSRAIQNYLEKRYWSIMGAKALARWHRWVVTHPEIGGYYQEGAWAEISHEFFESPEALEKCEMFINLCSKTIVIHSIFLGPIAIWLDLKGWLRARKLNKEQACLK